MIQIWSIQICNYTNFSVVVLIEHRLYYDQVILGGASLPLKKIKIQLVGW